MGRMKTYRLAVVTLSAAVSIGFAMQQHDARSKRAGTIQIARIEDTSSAALPSIPDDRAAAPRLPDAQHTLAAAVAEPKAAPATLPQEVEARPIDCAVSMAARTGAGAMVTVSIDAPCFASERLTIHHNGLMFTEVTQPDGTLRVEVPALAEQALFIAAFANGAGATALAEVPALPFYDRVVLQWRGNGGLSLHANEFGAAGDEAGHVWAAAAGDLTRTARGEGGFLTRLGDAASAEARLAEVYTFPAAASKTAGAVSLTIEAEITAANCGKELDAQTLERRLGNSLRARDLSLAMPDCSATGDFLVLKNLLEDLKIAAN
ncbi:translocase [Salipiger mangrovisoli]|uniref:Translocase n=1 Tax=Salipiger mangrovisoli TaxID=2865933 RepID=A0ABR9WZK4_9RHOB|nr:translocase [Salipiger mangrovisoli]MBE9636729.1 translocase [Salipiger mangrovisoli]